jgi:two-component system OmpR family response regulator
MKPRILILAADAGTRATLARWLMAAGYGVELAEGAKRAREVAAAESLALAIVAPEGLGQAGFDLAGELRQAAGGLIVVARPGHSGEGPDGADGIISEPLEEAEVLARVQAAVPLPLAQEDPAASAVLRFDGYTLNLGNRTCLAANGDIVPLTRAEFRLLREFAQQPGAVLSRDQLRQAVAGRDAEPDDRSVDVLVSRLRRKIEPDPREPRIIVTIAGRGYRFSSTPQVSAPALAPTDSGNPAPAAGPELTPAVAAPPPAPVARKGRARLIPGGLALVALAVLAALGWRFGPARPGSQSGEIFDAAAVPLVTDQVRRDLATYPAQRDHKAIALSEDGWAMAVAAADQESANKEALERCGERTVTNRFCRLYATGLQMVWHPVGVPLAADIHADPLDAPLQADELPDTFQKGREYIDEYLKLANHRAFAIRAMPATAGLLQKYSGYSFSSAGEVARLMVERCGYFYQGPCLLISVDGWLTVRIPKSRRIEDVFLLTTETQMSEPDRQKVADVYRQRDWRALARGNSGGWYAVANMASEAAAVEAALASCAKVEPGCRLYAIGNFRVADE